MTRTCDICREPVIEGQGLFGARGDGGRSGPKFGDLRHYQCHVDTHGKPGGLTLDRALVSAHTQRQMRELSAGPAPHPPAPQPAIKRPNVTKGEYNRSPNAVREWRQIGEPISEMGRRRVRVECPFCFTTFWGFVWSLAGGGKRCPNCGAKHTLMGRVAIPLTGNEDM